jgi:hypothetical protein
MNAHEQNSMTALIRPPKEILFLAVIVLILAAVTLVSFPVWNRDRMTFAFSAGAIVGVLGSVLAFFRPAHRRESVKAAEKRVTRPTVKLLFAQKDGTLHEVTGSIVGEASDFAAKLTIEKGLVFLSTKHFREELQKQIETSLDRVFALETDISAFNLIRCSKRDKKAFLSAFRSNLKSHLAEVASGAELSMVHRLSETHDLLEVDDMRIEEAVTTSEA